MPKILIREIIQITVYIAFGVFVTLTKFQILLYFALGFIIGTGIPSILLGYGFKGIKPAITVGHSRYEKFRGLPIANGIWGILHLVLAFFIYHSLKGKFHMGMNIETLFIAIGFCVVYMMVSITQKPEPA